MGPTSKGRDSRGMKSGDEGKGGEEGRGWKGGNVQLMYPVGDQILSAPLSVPRARARTLNQAYVWCAI